MYPIFIRDTRKQDELEHRLRILEYKQAGLTDEQIARLQAIYDQKKRAKERLNFTSHLVIFIAINVMLWVAFRGEWWLIFPTLGWGAGLFGHWLESRNA